jgi:electron transport complex protein RnfC
MQIAADSIVEFPRPPMLWVPMSHKEGSAARIVVEVGRAVGAGELIGRADGPGSLNVHAPLAGTVTAIGVVDTTRASDVPAVHIRTTDAKEPGALRANNKNRTPLYPPLVRGDKEMLSPLPRGDVSLDAPRGDVLLDAPSIEELADLADGAGLTDFGMVGMGLGDKLRDAASKGIDRIIINAIPAEPVLSAYKLILAEHVDEIITAGRWLQTALGAKRIWLAMDRADYQQVSSYRSATSGTPIRIIDLPNKYPQGSPVLLTKVITGRETPYGNSPMDVGILILEVEVLPALFAAVSYGWAMVDRVVAVGGPAAKRPGYYRIPLGTRFADVIHYVGISHSVARIVDGGLMTGRVVESLEAVVTKQTSCILLLDRNFDRIPNPGPCINCGWCQDDCPVGLDPQSMLDVWERAKVQRFSDLYPHACIECGLCSYVCPAELPLSEAVVKIKQQVSVDV